MSLLDTLLLDPYPFQIWIAKRTDSVKGSGTASDPYDGSTAIKLDSVLNGLTANTHIHLGAGSFDTNGYAVGAVGGWQPKAGMKIEGAGIGVTTLRLFNHTADAQYFAIGHALSAGEKTDFCEVSDLTIDCNLAGAGVETACSAMRLMGGHVRICRVKAINWGSNYIHSSISILSCITALPDSGVPGISHAGMEDCVVVLPSAANVGICTALACGNPDGVSFVSEGHGNTPYIRNCFVDSGVTTPDPAGGRYRGVSMSWCQGGVIEGNQIHNTDIGGPYLENKRSARDVIVRNNFYKNVGRGPYLNLGGLMPEAGPGTLDRNDTAGTISGLSSFTAFDAGARVKLVTSQADYSGVYVIQSKTSTSFTVTVPSPTFATGGGCLCISR